MNVAQSDGFTPLIVAVKEKDYNEKEKLVLRSENDMIYCVKFLLKSGADVNRVRHYGLTAAKLHITESRRHPPFRTVLTLLVAAGEIVDGAQIDPREGVKLRTCPIPEYIQQIEPREIWLSSLCRIAVRDHLMHLDRHSNLFRRIPKLGLPSSLTSYLLYDMSLEDKEQ